MHGPKYFLHTPNGPVPCEPPTPDQLRGMAEQREKLFTPDGQLRMVVETREACEKGRFVPGIGIIADAGNPTETRL